MLLWPLYTVYMDRKLAKEAKRYLKEFDDKKAHGTPALNASLTTSSTKTRSSRGVMYNMQSLDECLITNGVELQAFASFCAIKCLNGENVQFLEKVIKFKNEWARVFTVPNDSAAKARIHMYCSGVDIYLKLVDGRTARYPINVEGHIKMKLTALFGEAANLIAAPRSSTPRSNSSDATPWEAADPFTNPGNDHPLRPMLRRSIDKGSSTTELITELDGPIDPADPLRGIIVPVDFDQNCFDAAMASVKHMMWQQPWQEFMRSRRNSAASNS